MLCIIICTEGNVSEPTYLKWLKNSFINQAAFLQSINVEIVSVPLGGNQGHKKIIAKAEKNIEKSKSDPESFLCLLSDEDKIEKWLICDYDKMHKHHIDVNSLRTEAEEKGYKLIINKPNFEFFVLLHFLPFKEATGIKIGDYENIINDKIVELNKNNTDLKGFSSLMTVPNYSKPKNLYSANNFFGKLLTNNKEIIDFVIQNCGSNKDDKFSEMPLLIKKIKEIFE